MRHEILVIQQVLTQIEHRKVREPFEGLSVDFLDIVVVESQLCDCYVGKRLHPCDRIVLEADEFKRSFGPLVVF